MPKFLASCHYNEKKISWHLRKKKKKKDIDGPNQWQQICNRSNPEKKTGRSCEGTDFSWLSSKISPTLALSSIIHIDGFTYSKDAY